MQSRAIKRCVCSLLLTLTLTFVFGTVLAQDNFLPGYIIKTNQDTLIGEINYKDWWKNPDKIEFIKRGESQVERLLPADISAFSVGNTRYISRKVTIDETPFEIKQGTQILDTKKSSREAEVFLEVLIESDPINLYLYRHSRENFYIEGPQDFVELISHEYVARGLNNERNTTGDKGTGAGTPSIMREDADIYKYQLKKFFPYCDGQKPEETKYTQKSLVGFVLGCFENSDQQQITFVKKIDGYKYRSSIYLGSGITSFTKPFLWKNETLRSVGDIFVGYSAVIILPRNHGKRRVLFGIEYQSIKARDKDDFYEIEVTGTCRVDPTQCSRQREFEVQELKVDVSYLKFNVGYKHLFMEGRTSPFTLIGANSKLRLDYETYYRTETNLYDYHIDTGVQDLILSVTEEDEILVPTKITFAGFVGVGVQYKFMSLAMVYERGFGRSAFRDYNSLNLSFSVELPFRE